MSEILSRSLRSRINPFKPLSFSTDFLKSLTVDSFSCPLRANSAIPPSKFIKSESKLIPTGAILQRILRDLSDSGKKMCIFSLSKSL